MESNDWITVYNLHTQEINKNKRFIDICDCIIGDMLMGKVKFVNNKLEVFLNPKISELISEWKLMSLYLSQFNREIIVYRGVNNLNIMTKIEQPIPFSTCIEYENALLWKNDNGFVMKIFVSNNINYTFIDNKDEGYEVILPSGYLIQRKNNNNFVEYDFFENM